MILSLIAPLRFLLLKLMRLIDNSNNLACWRHILDPLIGSFYYWPRIWFISQILKGRRFGHIWLKSQSGHVSCEKFSFRSVVVIAFSKTTCTATMKVRQKKKTFKKGIHPDPVRIRKSAAGFDILVDDVVIIRLHAILTVFLHHSVCV